jgi:hypothetical protein
MDDYKQLSKKELINALKGSGIKGTSKMSKKELIEMIEENKDTLQGAGFFDFLSKAGSFISRGVSKAVSLPAKGIQRIFSPSKDLNNVSKKTLQQYGRFPIKRLQIYRTPLSKMLDTMLSAVSFGKIDELKEKYGYDKFYHLALVATLKLPKGEKNIIIEKNEAPNISTQYETSELTEMDELPPITREITLEQLIYNTIQAVQERFFKYDAFSTNCQLFIIDILRTNGLLDREAENFILQPMDKLAEELPAYVKGTAKFITDLGGTVAKLTGKGNKNSGYIKMLMAAQERKKGRLTRGFDDSKTQNKKYEKYGKSGYVKGNKLKGFSEYILQGYPSGIREKVDEQDFIFNKAEGLYRENLEKEKKKRGRPKAEPKLEDVDEDIKKLMRDISGGWNKTEIEVPPYNRKENLVKYLRSEYLKKLSKEDSKIFLERILEKLKNKELTKIKSLKNRFKFLQTLLPKKGNGILEGSGKFDRLFGDYMTNVIDDKTLISEFVKELDKNTLNVISYTPLDSYNFLESLTPRVIWNEMTKNTKATPVNINRFGDYIEKDFSSKTGGLTRYLKILFAQFKRIYDPKDGITPDPEVALFTRIISDILQIPEGTDSSIKSHQNYTETLSTLVVPKLVGKGLIRAYTILDLISGGLISATSFDNLMEKIQSKTFSNPIDEALRLFFIYDFEYTYLKEKCLHYVKGEPIDDFFKNSRYDYDRTLTNIIERRNRFLNVVIKNAIIEGLKFLSKRDNSYIPPEFLDVSPEMEARVEEDAQPAPDEEEEDAEAAPDEEEEDAEAAQEEEEKTTTTTTKPETKPPTKKSSKKGKKGKKELQKFDISKEIEKFKKAIEEKLGIPLEFLEPKAGEQYTGLINALEKNKDIESEATLKDVLKQAYGTLDKFVSKLGLFNPDKKRQFIQKNDIRKIKEVEDLVKTMERDKLNVPEAMRRGSKTTAIKIGEAEASKDFFALVEMIPVWEYERKILNDLVLEKWIDLPKKYQVGFSSLYTLYQNGRILKKDFNTQLDKLKTALKDELELKEIIENQRTSDERRERVERERSSSNEDDPTGLEASGKSGGQLNVLATPEQIKRGEFYEYKGRKWYKPKSKEDIEKEKARIQSTREGMRQEAIRKHYDQFGGIRGFRSRYRGAILGPMIATMNMSEEEGDVELYGATLKKFVDYLTTYGYFGNFTPATGYQDIDYKVAVNAINNPEMREELLSVLNDLIDNKFIGTFWAERIQVAEETRQREFEQAMARWRQQNPFLSILNGVAIGLKKFIEESFIQPVSNLTNNILQLLPLPSQLNFLKQGAQAFKDWSDKEALRNERLSYTANPDVLKATQGLATTFNPLSKVSEGLQTASLVSDVGRLMLGRGRIYDPIGMARNKIKDLPF